jgi:phage terminase Nu1 subunit (DNA packaging protein)
MGKTVTLNLSDINLISSRGLAQILGLNPDRIRQLEDEGILECQMQGRKKMYDLQSAVQTYVEYLRNQKKTSPAVNDSARKEKADADWKEAKADIERMKRDELAGKLHSAEDVEAVITDMVLAIRSAVLALPGRLARDISVETSATACSDMIKREVGDILNELAKYKYDPAVYREKVRERQGWSSEGIEAGAESDSDSD